MFGTSADQVCTAMEPGSTREVQDLTNTGQWCQICSRYESGAARMALDRSPVFAAGRPLVREIFRTRMLEESDCSGAIGLSCPWGGGRGWMGGRAAEKIPFISAPPTPLSVPRKRRGVP